MRENVLLWTPWHDFCMNWWLWMEKFFQTLKALWLWLTHGSKGMDWDFLCVCNLNTFFFAQIMWISLNATHIGRHNCNNVECLTWRPLKHLSWFLPFLLHFIYHSLLFAFFVVQLREASNRRKRTIWWKKRKRKNKKKRPRRTSLRKRWRWKLCTCSHNTHIKQSVHINFQSINWHLNWLCKSEFYRKTSSKPTSCFFFSIQSNKF